jgi:hypothetical protein
MNNEIKINIRDRWVRSIFELAHTEFQKRLWIEADYKNTVGSFSECVCTYFDDLSLEYGYSDFIKEGILSVSDVEIVKELHFKFSTYIELTEKKNLSDKNILIDVEWLNVTNIALKAWNKLKDSIDSKVSKRLMIELENIFLKGIRQILFFIISLKLF